MIKSKSWNWELVDKNDEFWNTPAPEVYFLAENWKEKNFKHILDAGCGYGRNCIFWQSVVFLLTALICQNEVLKQQSKTLEKTI